MNLLFNWINPTILLIALTSCTATKLPQTPQQVASGFWDATITQNTAKIREYSNETSPPSPDTLTPTWKNATVTFGEIQLKDNHALIETNIEFTEHNKPVSLSFTTVLKKQVSEWKVDQPKTVANILAKREEIDDKQNTAEKLMKKLRALGNQFTQNIDNATTELKKQMPEIKKDMESLGKNIGKEFTDAWKQYEPAVEKNLQEFTDAINNAIEQAKKKKEQENKPAPDPSVKLI